MILTPDFLRFLNLTMNSPRNILKPKAYILSPLRRCPSGCIGCPGPQSMLLPSCLGLRAYGFSPKPYSLIPITPASPNP